MHQASFRDAVLSAYGGRCAISHLPETRLLDAAHIVMDADEQFGQPVISNGLLLTKIHHAAFDAHLIGVDPEARRPARSGDFGYEGLRTTAAPFGPTHPAR